jgi:hypothetical protein
MRKRYDDIYSSSFLTSAYFDHTQVIELNPLSHVGYRLKHTALHGAQRYDEAIEVFEVMLAKLDNAHDMQTRSKP